MFLKLPAFTVVVTFLTLLVSHSVAFSQSDHLTDEEIELIRFHQELDKRVDVYVRAIERRFISLNGTSSLTEKEQKRLKKDEKKWGALPDGTKTKLLDDIEKIINEAIDKIDDVASRDMKSDLFPKAVHRLADAARKFLPQFESIAKQTNDARQIAIISSAVDYCNDIIDASSKVKKPTRKKGKKKRS